MGLSAVKILGASWRVYRALCSHLRIVPNPAVSTIDLLRAAIDDERKAGNRIVLYAATDGNHGRAVARMARLLILSDGALEKVAQRKPLAEDETGAKIYVPKEMYESTRGLIRCEGAHVIEVNGDYVAAVKACWDESKACQHGSAIMVQDNAFEYHEDSQLSMYRDIPSRIVEGYGTLPWECDEQSLVCITHVIIPIGMGSLGHAVVQWAKARQPAVKVIEVEPERAACLQATLKAGKPTVVKAEETIMSGMCCGTVSPISYETLRSGVHASIVLSEHEAHQAVLDLEEHGIEAGPCGAATSAGLREIVKNDAARDELQLNESSVIVMLSTEGPREYPIPEPQ